MSRYPPVPLERPLEVFGKSFEVELSTGLTLSPDTVLRAAVGKSLQTLLREDRKLLPIRQLRDGLLGRHRLSTTTRSTVQAAFGPMGSQFIGVLDGAAIPTEFTQVSDWSLLSATWDRDAHASSLGLVVGSFVKLDKFAEAVSQCALVSGRDAAETLLNDRFGPTLPAWRAFCPGLSLEGCLRIESSLLVIRELEAGTARGTGTAPIASPTVELLSPRAKPLGNWLRQVAAAVNCANNRELADLLARKAVLHKAGRPITHDTLKGWSAMKPGMLVSLEGCQALLSVVPSQEAAERLLARFALARFLAFLCDFLRSSSRSAAPSWAEAQQVLTTRFEQLAGSPWQVQSR